MEVLGVLQLALWMALSTVEQRVVFETMFLENHNFMELVLVVPLE